MAIYREMKRLSYIAIMVLTFISCNSNKKQNNNLKVPTVDSIKNNSNDSLSKDKLSVKKKNIIFSKIDSVSIAEIKQYVDVSRKVIFDYYAIEMIDEVEIWSNKLFGRCCTEADLDYSELLEFDITANINNPNYPYNNLSDKSYAKSFAFKENDTVEISIKLNRKQDGDWHQSQTLLLVDDVLKSKDTLLMPFKLSLVNGYVKSEKTFKENGRVKEIKLFLNNSFKGLVRLLDTPLVQEFELDFAFSKNDIVKLKPISYYKGGKYDDICISEIQSSLSQITHPSINEKYKVRELWKKGSAKNKLSNE